MRSICNLLRRLFYPLTVTLMVIVFIFAIRIQLGLIHQQSELHPVPGNCVPTPLPPTIDLSTRTPTPGINEFGTVPPLSPGVTPLAISKVNDTVPSLPDEDKYYVYIWRCNGTIELFKLSPATQIADAIKLNSGDVIMFTVPAASSMGHQAPTYSLSSTMAAPITPAVSTGVAYPQPQPAIIPILIPPWKLVGNPSISQSGFTLAINGVSLIRQRIIVFYSLSGTNLNQVISDENFQIIDEMGNKISLIKVIPLSKLDQVEVGLMVFEPRQVDVHELYLLMSMKLDPNNTQKILLAKYIGSAPEDFQGIYFGWPENNSELAGDQISILGGFPPENQSNGTNADILAASSTPIMGIQPTSTISVMKAMLPLPQDVIIQFEVSIKVENVSNHQVQYLGVQVLSDGNAFTVMNGISANPTPIVLVSLTPTPLPYTIPYP
jgi:hypothetical protein